MGPALIVLIGAAAVGGGILLLLSFGAAFGIARLLQTTRTVAIEDAIQLARSAAATGSSAPFVRVRGRIDSEEAFPDEHRRPLVFRRSRVQVRRARGWETLEESRERVAFAVQEGLDAIAIHDDDLDEGLIVVPRESTGLAAEARDRLPASVPSTAHVRLRIDQLSAVEHASVLGVPEIGPDGSPRIRAGRGRPLVVTPLEDAEAMRILAADAPRRPAAVATLLVGGLALLAAGTAWAALRLFVSV